MCGSRNFRQGGWGGPGQSDKKSSDNLFFLVFRFFYRSQMVNFKGIYHFKVPGGSNFFQGGRVNCLFPIETHITWGGGGSGPSVPPSGSALAIETGEKTPELGPSIKGLVTNGNTKLCCCGFILALFQGAIQPTKLIMNIPEIIRI